MAGAQLYLVGHDQQYKQVGEALAQLRADQGISAFTAAQEIRIVRSGVYEPFAVGASQLIPNGSSRLKFTVADGVNATVSGRVAPDRGHFGASVDTPYTDIDGIRFRDFQKGIVYGPSASYGRVMNTRVENCSNAGIWLDGVTETLVLNNALVDNDIGLGVTRGKQIVAVFNTIFQRQGKDVGVFFDIEDQGKLYLWSNILSCIGGACLRFFRRDVENRLQANWNNYWAPGGNVVEILENFGDSSLLTEVRSDYESWKRFMAGDEESMSTDPVFVNPRSTEQNPDIDVRLASASPLSRGSIAWGESPQTAQLLLPSWVDSTLLKKDKDSNDRGAISSRTIQIDDRTLVVDYLYPVTTIGAFDILAEPSFYNAPVFTDEEETPVVTTGVRRSVVQRSAGAYAKEVECWSPRVHRGYFWVRDREYYLYSEKRGCTLQDISRTFWTTSVNLIGSTVEVSIGSTSVAQDSWDIHGDQFVLHHKGLELTSMDDQVKVTGEYDEWSQTKQGFNRKKITLYLRLRDGETRYVLPETPKDSGPFIVTDDTIGRMNDRSFIPQQCRLKGSTIPGEEMELEFLHNNLLLNGDFHYGDSCAGNWEVKGISSTQLTKSGQRWPLRGDHMVQLTGGPNTGAYVGQQVRIDPDDSYFFSVYCGGGNLLFKALFLDAFNREITGYAHQVVLTATTGWHRVGARLTNATPDLTNTGAADVTAWFTEADIAMPTGAHSVLLQLSSDQAIVDCAQFEQGFQPSKFSSLPRGPDLTVEYEKGEGRFYEIEDLTLAAVRNPMHAGFLYIGAVPARQFDIGAPVNATTLGDWRWGTGRTDVLPWAKVHGINKLARVVAWNELDELQSPREISPGLPVPNPSEIEMDPGQLVARQGNSGEYSVVEVRDDQGNPYAFERVQLDLYCDNGAFPGYLSLSRWGLPTNLGQSIIGRTNERGQLSVRFIPPNPDQIEFRGTKPAATEQFSTGDTVLYESAFLDLPYPVNEENHGNPTIHQEDGGLVSIEGVTTAMRVFPVSEDGNATYHLTGYYPVPNTMVFQLESPTGGLSYPFGETYNEIPGVAEFKTNYEQGKLSIKGTTRQPARIVMKTRTVWRDPKFPNRLYFDSRYLAEVTGDIVVRYDSFARLQVRALPPEGLDTGTDAWREFDGMIMQNPHRGEVS